MKFCCPKRSPNPTVVNQSCWLFCYWLGLCTSRTWWWVLNGIYVTGDSWFYYGKPIKPILEHRFIKRPLFQPHRASIWTKQWARLHPDSKMATGPDHRRPPPASEKTLAPYRCRMGWCTLGSPGEDPYTRPSRAPTSCSAAASAGSRCCRWRCTSTTAPTPATDPPLGRRQMGQRRGNGCGWRGGVLIISKVVKQVQMGHILGKKVIILTSTEATINIKEPFDRNNTAVIVLVIILPFLCWNRQFTHLLLLLISRHAEMKITQTPSHFSWDALSILC